MSESGEPRRFVDEMPANAPRIEGVSTSTAAFVGRAGEHPADEPVLATGPGDVDARFGSADDLGRAAHAFFESGGKRLFLQSIAHDGQVPDALRALEAVDEIALVAAPGM